jgi:hypothetical protein
VRCLQLVAVGAGTARRPEALDEEALGIVIGLGLHVLAERERDRAAFGWVSQHLHSARERGDDLLGPGDAVEIA